MNGNQTTVTRTDIVRKILRRELCKETDIRKLCEKEDVKDLFIGSRYEKKHPRSEWNQKYLDKLQLVAVGESFNLDYLLYLNDVTKHVKKARFVKCVIAGVVVILVIVAGVVVLVLRGKGALAPSAPASGLATKQIIDNTQPVIAADAEILYENGL